MARRVSMSKAKRLTESLRSKNRRFQESADSVYDWFESEWLDLDTYTLTASQIPNEFDSFDGLPQAIKYAFKSSDKVRYSFGYEEELEDLENLAWKEDKRPKVFRETSIFKVNTGRVEDEFVVIASNSFGEFFVAVLD